MNPTPAYRSAQEAFWAGDFGTDYIQRNQGSQLLAANLDFFAKALRQARQLGSCIEFGANIGMNLRALQLLLPQLQAHAIEINPDAATQLRSLLGPEQVHQGSILDFQPQRQWDLVFTKGVLIHINPELLPQVYDLMVAASARYVLVAEYYNPAPVAIPYRGHADRLFKRDFAGEILDRHPQLQLVDYGFAYRRDPNFPQDDISWFLLEKRVQPA
ncbi:MAG: pseudaminic acid biosynthesis-associated methylase [Pseudomonadota bacterium]